MWELQFVKYKTWFLLLIPKFLADVAWKSSLENLLYE